MCKIWCVKLQTTREIVMSSFQKVGLHDAISLLQVSASANQKTTSTEIAIEVVFWLVIACFCDREIASCNPTLRIKNCKTFIVLIFGLEATSVHVHFTVWPKSRLLRVGLHTRSKFQMQISRDRNDGFHKSNVIL